MDSTLDTLRRHADECFICRAILESYQDKRQLAPLMIGGLMIDVEKQRQHIQAHDLNVQNAPQSDQTAA